MHTKLGVEGNKAGTNKDQNKRQRQIRGKKGSMVESSPEGLREKRGCFSHSLCIAHTHL